VTVPAKSVVTFKPGKEMEARVREHDRQVAQGLEPTAGQRPTPQAENEQKGEPSRPA
jgi:hypothetical protein